MTGPSRYTLRTASKAKLEVLSGVWLMVRVKPRSPGWPVRDLMAICRSLMEGEDVGRYLSSGAETEFRRFVRRWPDYLNYDGGRDTVAVAHPSISTAVEQCLIRHLALRIQASGGCLEIKREPIGTWSSILPEAVETHFRVVYCGNLELFMRLHPAAFTVDAEGVLAQLSDSFEETDEATRRSEQGLILFFVDLLQKIGATEDTPCGVHAVTRYLPFMEREDRKLLDKVYHFNLNVFFELNPCDFVVKKGQKCVFLRNPDPHYGAALFLKQQLQIESASGRSPKVSAEDLCSRARYSSSPHAQCFSGVSSAAVRVAEVARRHPDIFCVAEQGYELWLRKKCAPWPDKEWKAEAEWLAVAYFIEVLKHVEATSPPRAICFNYIVRAVSAAPPSCKTYLETVYPALEIIGFFHLHPGVFDLSSVNRVFLREGTPSTETAPARAGEEPSCGSADEQAVTYVAKLLKYAPDLNNDLLVACMESVSHVIRDYCLASVKHRLQSVIERGRAALCAPKTEAAADSKCPSVTREPTKKKKHASKQRKTTQAHSQKNYPCRVFCSTKTKKDEACGVLPENAASVTPLGTTKGFEKRPEISDQSPAAKRRQATNR